MFVYWAHVSYPYGEGNATLGIFSTQEKAKAYAEKEIEKSMDREDWPAQMWLKQGKSTITANDGYGWYYITKTRVQ